MYKNAKDKTSKYILIEALCGISAIAFCVYLLRSLLIFGDTTFQHDVYAWGLPIFHFFAESIANGHYPLWNPFSHSGEPFYPLIVSVRLLEPITLLTAYLGHFIVDDTVVLFSWAIFLQSLIMAFGVYIVLRPLTANIFVRLSLMPVLLFSSFMLASFHQDGILYQFVWAPYVAYFLTRIIYYKDTRWSNWLMLAAVTGINQQSYFFSGIWIFILFFLLAILLFKRDLLFALLKSEKLTIKLAITATILFLMMAPNIALVMESDKYVNPPRMTVPNYENLPPQGMPGNCDERQMSNAHYVNGMRMPYEYIAFTGTFSTIWNFIQIIAPDANGYLHWANRGGWGSPSEAYIYIGLLPWAVALLGVVAGGHDMKRVWFFLLIFFGLLMLGPAGGVHRLLYYFFPPVWTIRHLHMLTLFFVFAVLYFYVIGLNRIFSAMENKEAVFDNLGKKTLYLSLILLHIIAVLMFCIYYGANTRKFIVTVILALGIPIVLFLFAKMRKKWSNPLIIGTIFIIFISLDLVHAFTKTSFFYSKEHPAKYYNVNTNMQKEMPLEHRFSYPDNPASNGMDQYVDMGYLALMRRRSFVFSPVEPGGVDPRFVEGDDFEYALKNLHKCSPILLKNHAKLIGMDISPAILKEMYAVNKSPFQFKTGYVKIGDDDLATFFKQLGDAGASIFLKNFVVVDADLNLRLPDYPSLAQKARTGTSEFTYSPENYRHDSFDMRVLSEKTGLLYWADGYDDNWHAYINGIEAPIYRANVNFKAISVSEGISNIHFEYEPRLFINSLYIFYGALLITVSAALLLRRLS